MGRKAKVQALLAALIAWPTWAQTYNPALIPPQLLGSPQGMTALNLGDDNTRSVNLGFTFDYYGKNYTSAWVSSNGFVSFQGPANLCCSGTPMQNAQRNSIYAYWTDLISGPNPYYKPIEGGILFGWYGTNEYGTGNKNTFEIALYANGNIQIDYGAVANSYHYVAAGLTGPTTSDNVQLFYGTNVTSLNNQSGLLSLSAPKVEPPAPVAVVPSPAPTVAPNPVATPTVTTQAIVQATEVLQNSSINTSATPVQTTPTAQTTEVAVVTASASPAADQTTQQAATVTATATATTTTQQDAKEEQKEAPLPPGGIPGVFVAVSIPGKPTEGGQVTQVTQQAEVKKDKPKEAVAASEMAIAKAERDSVIVVNTQDVETLAKLDTQYTQKYGDQKTTDTVDVTYSLDPQSGTSFGQVATVSGQANPTPIVAFSPTTDTQTNQSQQILLLTMQNDLSSGTPKDVADVSQEEAQTMAQLAVTPTGYSAYTQARIPDVPFYRPRDIYLNKRIPDANVALFRMMRGQDQLWDKMTEAQYER